MVAVDDAEDVRYSGFLQEAMAADGAEAGDVEVGPDFAYAHVDFFVLGEAVGFVGFEVSLEHSGRGFEGLEL